MMRRTFALTVSAMVVCLVGTGCAGGNRIPTAAKPGPADWRRVVTRADFARIHDWRDAFIKALNAATLGGAAGKIAAEGSLLQPDGAIEGADLPGGRYRCRTIKLGSQGNGPTFVAYPPFECIVADEGEVSSFAKLQGSQRPVGLVFDADTRRKIFLGTLMLGDEKTALEYGRDAERDMAGVIERIGPRRWRLILPYPRFESVLDVIELVPAA